MPEKHQKYLNELPGDASISHTGVKEAFNRI